MRTPFFIGVDKSVGGQHLQQGDVSDMRNFRCDTGVLVKRPGLEKVRELDMGLNGWYWPWMIFDFSFLFSSDFGVRYNFVMPAEGAMDWPDFPDLVWDDRPVYFPPRAADDTVTVDVETAAV